MKLPNKYGSITKLAGNRRKPYMVREGKTGQQKPIAYTSTREEALQILAEFNLSGKRNTPKTMTFQELYDFFLKKRGEKLGKSTVHSLNSVIRYCSALVDYDYHEIKAYDMQECIDGCGHGYATQNAIKNLFFHLDRFALELDLCSHNFSSILTSDSPSESKKTIFTQDEREKLWKNQNSPWVDTVLIFIYTGFRISELLEMKKDQVDLLLGTITGGKKTKCGKNRIVPIHPKILPLIEKRMKSEGDFLISYRGKATTESNYRKNWKKMMELYHMKHTPHECRHTFRSLLDSAGANQICIDRMMGHKTVGTGGRIYTHKTIEELRKNLELE